MLESWGCGLYTSAAYTRVFTVVNFVHNLPDGQVRFFEEFKSQNNCEINSAYQMFLGLVDITFGLVCASFSLPEWQA